LTIPKAITPITHSRVDVCITRSEPDVAWTRGDDWEAGDEVEAEVADAELSEDVNPPLPEAGLLNPADD